MAEKGLAETGADLFLGGLWIARDAELETDRPSQYLRLLAAGHLGGGVLTSDGPIYGRADSALGLALALGLSRLHHYDSDSAREALEFENASTFYSLRDILVENVLPKITRHRATKQEEYNAIELVASHYRASRRDAETASQQVMAATLDSLRHPVTTLLQSMGRLKPVLLAGEAAGWLEAQHLLGNPFTRFHEDMGAAETPPGALERAQAYQDSLARFSDKYFLGTYVSSALLVNAIKTIEQVVRQSLASVVQRLQPQLALRRATRRYPIGSAGTFALPLEIRNTGTGGASEVLIRATAAELAGKEVSTSISSIAAGESSTLSLDIPLERAVQTLRLEVSIQCLTSLGTAAAFSDEIVLDAQTAEPDWEALLRRAPYALNPVEDVDRLWGRDAQLEAIRLHISRGTSCVVWGQKRVGKTSVARVLFHEFARRADSITLYFRKGDLAGYNEGEIAYEIAERLTSAADRVLGDGSSEKWSLESFGTRLTKLTRVIDRLRERGLKQRVVLFFDEFDELGKFIYDNERGDDFFGTLRAISERDVVFVLVGSERMPSIFQLYGSLLNKCETLRLDTIERRSDISQMIVEPVRGFLEYDPDAQAQIASLAGGNPYYVNLLCSRLLHMMVTARRTCIDIVDVQRAAAVLAKDASPTNWSHLWEDNESYTVKSRAQREHECMLVLSAFERRPSETPISAAQVKAVVEAEFEGELPGSHAVEDALQQLVKRRVLETIPGDRTALYQARPLLFRSWLIENARSQLITALRSEEEAPSDGNTGERQIVLFAQEFPLTDEELLPVADGLMYRGKSVDAMSVKLWLKQFKTNARIIMAYRLLYAMRKNWYIDDAVRGLLLEKAYEALTSRAAELSIQLARSSEERSPAGRSDYLRNVERFRGELTNVFAAYLGDALKSGPDCVRDFRKMMRIRAAGGLAEASAWLAKQSESSIVIILDDFVGSGYQAQKAFRGWLRQSASEPSFARALAGGRIMFAPLLAYKEGLLEVQDTVRELRLAPVRLLDGSDMAFDGRASIFESNDEMLQAQAMCDEIGTQLWPDHPLGWEGVQSLVVFNNAVPNATLPILWKDGLVDGQPWRALFPR